MGIDWCGSKHRRTPASIWLTSLPSFETRKRAGALVAVDNTTMTPLGQRPLDLGADVVVSADTKALNGHSDVLFGHVSSRNSQLISAVRDWRKIAGAVPGPHEAWLVHRGLETLEVRYSRMCANALRSPSVWRNIRRWPLCAIRASHRIQRIALRKRR